MGHHANLVKSRTSILVSTQLDQRDAGAEAPASAGQGVPDDHDAGATSTRGPPGGTAGAGATSTAPAAAVLTGPTVRRAGRTALAGASQRRPRSAAVRTPTGPATGTVDQ